MIVRLAVSGRLGAGEILFHAATAEKPMARHFFSPGETLVNGREDDCQMASIAFSKCRQHFSQAGYKDTTTRNGGL
jgi:hypothetical protein